MSETKPDPLVDGVRLRFRSGIEPVSSCAACAPAIQKALKQAVSVAVAMLREREKRIADLCKERDLVADKWKQMEAYGFDSPSAVFARIAELEKALDEQNDRICRAILRERDMPQHADAPNFRDGLQVAEHIARHIDRQQPGAGDK